MNSVQKKIMFNLYDDPRVWCQLDNADYCPLIIVLMSSIILLSFVLIVYLCARTSFKCLRCRKLNNQSESTIHLETSSLNIPTLSSQINETRSNFTKTQRPPPSYQESLGKTRFIRTYPRVKPSAQINSAFSMDTDSQSVVFPQYTCLSLVSSPSNNVRHDTQLIVSQSLFQSDEVPPSYETVMARSERDNDVVYF